MPGALPPPQLLHALGWALIPSGNVFPALGRPGGDTGIHTQTQEFQRKWRNIYYFGYFCGFGLFLVLLIIFSFFFSIIYCPNIKEVLHAEHQSFSYENQSLLLLYKNSHLSHFDSFLQPQAAQVPLLDSSRCPSTAAQRMPVPTLPSSSW